MDHHGARSTTLANALRRDLSVALAAALHGDAARGRLPDGVPVDVEHLIAGAPDKCALRECVSL